MPDIERNQSTQPTVPKAALRAMEDSDEPLPDAVAAAWDAEEDDTQEAWRAGTEARRSGVKVSSNPHPPGSRPGNAWRGAWMAEDRAIRQPS